MSGEPVGNRRFYGYELQRVSGDTLARVERIIGRRMRNGQLEYRIKWLGYDSSYNSWEPADNVFELSSL